MKTKTKTDTIKAFEELMNKYNYYRNEWIKKNESDLGFDEWFSSQITVN